MKIGRAVPYQSSRGKHDHAARIEVNRHPGGFPGQQQERQESQDHGDSRYRFR